LIATEPVWVLVSRRDAQKWSQFRTVEIDSSFYGTPSAKTVESWYEKTPADFVLEAKVPHVVTHDNVLLDCDAEFGEFIDIMGNLKEKLGPLVLQFPRFDEWVLKSPDELRGRLQSFFKTSSGPECRSVRSRGSEQGLA